MKKILRIRPLWMFILFAIADIICIGMGMGVPFFCILFGFIVGWFLVNLTATTVTDIPQVLRKVLIYAILTAGFTLVAMLVLWGPFASYLFDPSKDLANTGIPMILFQPRASFIGWIILMMFISPFLQLLTTIFSAYLTMLFWMKKGTDAQKIV